MKILLLNQAFHPDIVATAQLLADAALALAQRGHEVTVIASRRAYDDLKRKFPSRELWHGVRIIRIGNTGFGKGTPWRRAADFASFIAACVWRLLWLERPDAVVALTTPPLISFIAAWYAKLRGAKFFYWIMDLNPDEAIAAGWLRERTIAARVLHRMSQFSLRRARKVVALDRFMQSRIAAKGIASSNVVVIPPWSHDEAVRFDPERRESFRKRHGLDGRFVVMYSGNHSPCHPLATLLAAARQMSRDERFAFLFVGGGSEFARVGRFAAENRLGNVKCLPYQPMEELSASLSAADLHVVVMGDPFVGIVHPCKIYNVLSVGAPVLYIGPGLSHLSEVLDALESKVCGVVAHGDVERCVGEIRRIASLNQRGEAARYTAVGRAFSRAVLLPQWVSTLELASSNLGARAASVSNNSGMALN